MPAPITRSLAEFASGLTFEDLPGTAVEAVITGFTDSVAVMYSGMAFPISRIALETIGTRGLGTESRLLLGAERASSIDAALVNSATLGAGVFDDVAFAGCHTSVILLPALFAEADALGLGGRDVIRAYAAGYEAWARLSERDPDAYSSKGWHATAAFGPVAGAIAVANLRRFDAAQTARAIGIAAAMSGGITRSFDFEIGPFQVARASAAAVHAARLAQAGLTAAEDALEFAGRGLLSALSPRGQVDLDRPIDDLGRAWRLETVGIHVKQHPVGNMMQRALDGILDLVRGHDVTPEQVVRIEALISEAQMEVHRKSPSTSGGHLVPSHSIAVALAAALIDRRMTYDHLTEVFHGRDDVRAVMDRVEIVPDPAIPADTTPNLGFSGGIRLHLRDGRVLEAPSVPFARGHWTRRLTADDAWRKFSTCTEGQLSLRAARILFDQLQSLDGLDAIRDLNPPD
ncbi:MmgE/PrpD family protein [Inquilinus sp.]|jgi:2-methylcitrate dehydratase PrpD|uniref:MmgE/PrpD family protein n=1 Tax=Inquilinus sp. TaxID=1932117 RepID=UPI0037834F56